MRRLVHSRSHVAILLGFWLMGSVGCTDEVQEEPLPVPVVTIAGNHGVEVGQTVGLTASTDDGSDTGYYWSSADSEIASVDQAGVVTGVGAGETTVTATGTESLEVGEHAVVVIALPDEDDPVVIVFGEFVVGVGLSITLAAETIGGEDGAYSWSSADEALATVTSDGIVTGVAPGEVVVTAEGDSSHVSGDMLIVVTLDPPGETPYDDEWLSSAHADETAEAFVHWDEDGVIEADCARCHSTYGFFDYLGEDGTAAGSVEDDAALGTVIECQACHNPSAAALDSAHFPSGVEIAGLGSEARCMACHQGRESTDSLDQAIADAEVADDDATDEDLSFVNIHYAAAGATQHGGLVRGGYQYEGQSYDTRFEHVPGRQACFDCHDSHTLAVQTDNCLDCHEDLADVDDTHDIRTMSSFPVDYDGDGDTEEGLYDEIEALQQTLLTLLVTYPGDQGLDPLCYDGETYPYFFIDTDANGTCNDSEPQYGNQYVSWTARLLRAAYNYQFAAKDPGGFAHNGKYVIQLQHDAIADLNAVVSNPVDMSAAERDDRGHFHGSSDAFRHFDEDGAVSSSCSPCHGGSTGFHFYLDHGVGLETDVANGLDCATCHADGKTPDLIAVDSVTYPGGTVVEDAGNPANLCATCHAGRESKSTVDDAIDAGSFSFLNVHYMPAAGVWLGTEAQVGYEYDGQTYAGRYVHSESTGCTYCHVPAATNHTFLPDDDLAACVDCHEGVTSVRDIRELTNTTDWDGDGDATEPLADELDTVAQALLAEIQLAAVAQGGEPICYDAHAYPYFFNDTDVSGDCDAAEAIYPNLYTDWTPSLMRATFNYQLSQKEPGAWAHNFPYALQLLVDSADDLGGDTSAYTRP